MKGRIWLTALLLVFLCLASTAFAEQVVEVWKYPWPGMDDIAASADDGSVWVTSWGSGSVLRLAPGFGGELLEVVRVRGFASPSALGVNSADGSCWVGDWVLGQVVHLAADGTELSRTGDMGGPVGLSADSIDGSCWVTSRKSPGAYFLAHLAADGTLLSRTAYSNVGREIAAVPGTNSCWFYDCGFREVVHVQENPDHSITILSTPGMVGNCSRISVDGVDGTLWVSNWSDSGTVLHLRENLDHTITTLSATLLCEPGSVSAVPGGGAWVVERRPDGLGSAASPVVRHLNAGGDVDATVTDISGASLVSTDISDGSCWVLGPGDLVHLTPAADEAQREACFDEPKAVAADPSDGSSWVADCGAGRVSHLAANGDVITSVGGFGKPVSVALDPVDGSVWVADRGVKCVRYGLSNEVVHLASDGTVIARTPEFDTPVSVAVDPNDGACWVADDGITRDSVVRLAAADGLPTYGARFNSPTVVAVDPEDSSIWVGDSRGGMFAGALVTPPVVPNGDWLVHLAFAEGATEPTLLSAVPMAAAPNSLAVDPFDPSCLVTLNVGGDAGYGLPVLRVTEGTPEPTVALLGSFALPQSVSISPRDRSIWVGGQHYVSHMTAEGTVLSRSGAYCCVGSVSVDAVTGKCWAADPESGALAELAVALEAGFVASRTSGTAPLAVSFTDLSTGYPTSWEWDFGDGGTSADQNPSHTYAAGLYTVSLRVEGAGGSDTEVKPNYIHAAIALTAAFSSDVTRGASPLTVQFTDESTAGTASWLWNFGDGDTSTARNPSHTYEDPGFYTVTLTVEGDGVSASTTKSACIAVGFTDTPGDHWAFMQEIACAEASIVQGYWDGTYRPNEAVNRAQMATYIARALADGDENVPSGPSTPTFTDVEEDHWAFRYIEYCAGRDIVTGYGGGTYRPDETVNRGQMAVFIARMVAIPTGLEGYVPGTIPIFPDVTSANEWAWCYQYVQYLGALDPPIVAGYPDGNYKPANTVTRDQMAVYMQRAFDLPIPSSTP